MQINNLTVFTIGNNLGIAWQDKASNTEVLSGAGLSSMFTLLRQRSLRLLGHAHRMQDRLVSFSKYLMNIALQMESTLT